MDKEKKIEIAPGLYAEVLKNTAVRTVKLTNLTGYLDIRLTKEQKEKLDRLFKDD